MKILFLTFASVILCSCTSNNQPILNYPSPAQYGMSVRYHIDLPIFFYNPDICVLFEGKSEVPCFSGTIEVNKFIVSNKTNHTHVLEGLDFFDSCHFVLDDQEFWIATSSTAGVPEDHFVIWTNNPHLKEATYSALEMDPNTKEPSILDYRKNGIPDAVKRNNKLD